MPELTQTGQEAWLNSPPLTREQLVGRVVMLDFWTFDCWNCYRSFPWLNAMETRLPGDEFVVIGIHSPEFEHEHDRARVADKIKEFELHHPVMMDNDFAFWRAVGNHAWPTFYLVDKSGTVRHRFIGETHEGDAQAKAIESAIRALLSEGGGG